ncbi:hypothetical protein AAVH_26408, partial [Aphelenchoides avenae]
DSIRQFEEAYEYKIRENEVGHSFEQIFSRCIDDGVTHVKIKDPYISNSRQ